MLKTLINNTIITTSAKSRFVLKYPVAAFPPDSLTSKKAASDADVKLPRLLQIAFTVVMFVRSAGFGLRDGTMEVIGIFTIV